MVAHIAGSVEKIRAAKEFSITGFPLYGVVVTPDDNQDLSMPGYIRVDTAGVITAQPYGGGDTIVCNLVAGEFFPCMVTRVYDTGTDDIVIHCFY